MGREIRKVTPDWEHPMQDCQHSPWKGGCDESKRNNGKCYRPLYDNDYETACEQWYAGLADFKPGKYARWYHEEGGPPDEESYRSQKWSADEATHFQVYETVSEGTPVTPHFATKAELIDYLVANGDFWDQMRGGKGGWSRAAAERFVENEWAPSLVVETTAAGVSIKSARDGA